MDDAHVMQQCAAAIHTMFNSSQPIQLVRHPKTRMPSTRLPTPEIAMLNTQSSPPGLQFASVLHRSAPDVFSLNFSFAFP